MLVIQIPLDLSDDVDPNIVARAMRGLEARIAETMIAEGVHVGEPTSALVPSAMLQEARRKAGAKRAPARDARKGRQPR